MDNTSRIQKKHFYQKFPNERPKTSTPMEKPFSVSGIQRKERADAQSKTMSFCSLCSTIGFPTKPAD
jgi:hypothetical protein